MEIVKMILKGIGMTFGGSVFLSLMFGAYQSRLDAQLEIPSWFDIICFLFLSFAMGKLLYANIKYEEIMKEKNE